MTTPNSQLSSSGLQPSLYRWPILSMLMATHIKQKASLCDYLFPSHLLPRPPFPFLLPSFTPLLPLWLSLPVSPCPLTFPLPPFYPPVQPSSSCRFVVLLSSSSAPLHSSLPLSPSFHFGFSDSGNEMFHYLHFTAFNRERI